MAIDHSRGDESADVRSNPEPTRREALSWSLGCVLGGVAGFSGVVKARADDAGAERSRVLLRCRGTYGSPPRLAKGGRVDVPRLLSELADLSADTYHWLVHGPATDWDDLKAFLPKAREQGLKVWVTVCPPSEQPPKNSAWSEPFRIDFERWAAEIAGLSVAEPNLVAWSIDDFTHNLGFFTPKRVGDMAEASRKINPRLAFAPCCYFPKITRKFVEDYRHGLDGILFPYRAESGKPNLTDPSLVATEVEKLRAVVGPSLPLIVDVYATRHSRLGDSTADYVRAVMAEGWKTADGVLVYRHQDPVQNAEKYGVIKELFHEWAAR